MAGGPSEPLPTVWQILVLAEVEPLAMVKRASIEFIESKVPIREMVTKFGGPPVWVKAPRWPTSRATGQPMQFIGQIALDPELFGPVRGRMAYLFMTDAEASVDGTWEPDSRENDVIIQPGDDKFSACHNDGRRKTAGFARQAHKADP